MPNRTKVLVFCACLALAPAARAGLIVVDFAGVITAAAAEAFPGLSAPAIRAGDPIAGRFSYDPDDPRNRPHPLLGDPLALTWDYVPSATLSFSGPAYGSGAFPNPALRAGDLLPGATGVEARSVVWGAPAVDATFIFDLISGTGSLAWSIDAPVTVTLAAMLHRADDPADPAAVPEPPGWGLGLAGLGLLGLWGSRRSRGKASSRAASRAAPRA